MIIIIHGSDQTSTRNQLLLIKNKYRETSFIEGKQLTDNQIVSEMESGSLFYNDSKKLIIVEKFFGININRDRILKYLLEINDSANDLLIWEDREVKNKDFAAISNKAKVIKLNLPSVIFKLLDNIYPKNITSIVKLLNEVCHSVEKEIIFHMVVKQFRILIQVKSLCGKGSSEFNKILPWQKIKLNNQAANFTLKQLLYIYKKLQQMDYNTKTGRTDTDIIDRLKVFFINYLE